MSTAWSLSIQTSNSIGILKILAVLVIGPKLNIGYTHLVIYAVSFISVYCIPVFLKDRYPKFMGHHLS
jgi:hypothetical protein